MISPVISSSPFRRDCSMRSYVILSGSAKDRPFLHLFRHAAVPGRSQLPAAADQRPALPLRHQPVGRADGFRGSEVAAAGGNPHVKCEPSSRGGRQQQAHSAPAPRVFVQGELGREAISRPNNFAQAGDRYRTFADWERDDLIANLVEANGMFVDVPEVRFLELGQVTLVAPSCRGWPCCRNYREPPFE